MLHVYVKDVSEYDDVLTEDNYRINPTLWFDNQGGEDYITGKLESEIIKDIDGSTVISNGVLENPIFGSITPEDISGTAKTLILIHNKPEFYYNGAHMGENAAQWLVLMAKTQEIYIRMGYLMPFPEPFNIHFINTNKYVSTWVDYLYEYGE